MSPELSEGALELVRELLLKLSAEVDRLGILLGVKELLKGMFDLVEALVTVVFHVVYVERLVARARIRGRMERSREAEAGVNLQMMSRGTHKERRSA